jgi:hypothetical protein
MGTNRTGLIYNSTREIFPAGFRGSVPLRSLPLAALIRKASRKLRLRQ